MRPDLAGKVALITGGTAGVGLATGLELGAAGAQCWLTFRFGSADEDAIRAAFAERGAPEPVFVQSDIGLAEDNAELVARLQAEVECLDIFISNAANALIVGELGDWSLRGLQQSVRGSVWPTLGICQALIEAFGAPPAYVIAMSSDGPDHHAPGYGMIAATKAMLEAAVRYLAVELGPRGCRVNAIRSRGVPTKSLDAVFGPELRAFTAGHAPERWWVPAEEVAGAALALCSGRLDAINGQVLTIDRGGAFADNLMGLFVERERRGAS